MNRIICGVDVSKARLDACVVAAEPVFESFDNSAPGVDALAAFCRRQGVDLVVMEATGGYERQPFLLLWAQGQASAIANPRQVRSFAQAMGYLEKTDRLDANVIARFASARNLQPTPPPSAAALRLKALVARLRQVTDDLTAQKQRRDTAHDAEMAASISEVVALLKRQSKTLEQDIGALIGEDPLWRKLDAAFRSVKGVASRTVARLMADLPEIGVISNKAAAKIAGLAPIADDSGKRSGNRHIRGGRAGVRSILYLVANIARRFHQGLADFHQRLQQAGKAKMTIRIALARKLLVILNAKARDARHEIAAAA